MRRHWIKQTVTRCEQTKGQHIVSTGIKSNLYELYTTEYTGSIVDNKERRMA